MSLLHGQHGQHGQGADASGGPIDGGLMTAALMRTPDAIVGTETIASTPGQNGTLEADKRLQRMDPEFRCTVLVSELLEDIAFEFEIHQDQERPTAQAVSLMRRKAGDGAVDHNPSSPDRPPRGRPGRCRPGLSRYLHSLHDLRVGRMSRRADHGPDDGADLTEQLERALPNVLGPELSRMMMPIVHDLLSAFKDFLDDPASVLSDDARINDYRKLGSDLTGQAPAYLSDEALPKPGKGCIIGVIDDAIPFVHQRFTCPAISAAWPRSGYRMRTAGQGWGSICPRVRNGGG